MNQATLEALLGRSLTPNEVTNLTLYLNIAYESLEELICTPIAPADDTRVFDLREGYSTAFLGIFRSVSEVKIDGNIITSDKYSLRQWDKRNASWYNSLVFDHLFSKSDKEIEVTASWGFPTTPTNTIPVGLQSLIAGLFDHITKKNKLNPTVASKQNREYRISFNKDVDLDDEFYNKYRKTISKYSLCNIPNVQHGDISCGC